MTDPIDEVEAALLANANEPSIAAQDPQEILANIDPERDIAAARRQADAVLAQQEAAKKQAEIAKAKSSEQEIKIGPDLRPIVTFRKTNNAPAKVETPAEEAPLPILAKADAERVVANTPTPQAPVQKPVEETVAPTPPVEETEAPTRPVLVNTQVPAPESVPAPRAEPTPAPVVAKEEAPAEQTTASEPKSTEFNIAESLENAKVDGNLALLRKGSKNHGAIEHAQRTLVKTGFLQTDDESAPNYINPEHFGRMEGNVTTDALRRLQQSVKDAGGEIKVDSAKRVRGYTETWTALAVAEHAGIKDGKFTAEAAELYNESKKDEGLKSIASFNSEIIEGIERIKESPLGAQNANDLRFASEKSAVVQLG